MQAHIMFGKTMLKVLFLFLTILLPIIPAQCQNAPLLPLPADTTTFYADTACYLKTPAPALTDTLAAAYLTRLGTMSYLLKLHTTQQPPAALQKTVMPPPPMLVLQPDTMASDTASSAPPPLWYNITHLPQFTGNDIATNSFLQPLRPVSEVKTVLFYIFLVIAVLYAFLSYNYAKYLAKLNEAVFNIYIARQFYDDFNHSGFVLNALFAVITVSTFGLFAYLGVTYFGKLQQVESYFLMAALVVAVGVYLSIRRMMLRLIALILPLSELIYFYLFNLRIINITASIMLLPMLLLMAFGGPVIEQVALYLSLITLALTITFIVLRGLTIVKEFVLRYKFHFILYLCTLEIAPLLILYKVASKYVL